LILVTLMNILLLTVVFLSEYSVCLASCSLSITENTHILSINHFLKSKLIQILKCLLLTILFIQNVLEFKFIIYVFILLVQLNPNGILWNLNILWNIIQWFEFDNHFVLIILVLTHLSFINIIINIYLKLSIIINQSSFI